MPDIDYKFKIIITGKEAVGKTSLIRRYVDDKFSESYVPTLQSDFTSKTIHLREKRIKLLIYELGGHKKFRTDQQRYFKGADYICTVASFDDKKSIGMVRDLIDISNEAYDKMNRGGHVQNMVIVNKSDLVNQKKRRAIEYGYKKILKKMTDGIQNSGFLFTSAKTDDNVDVMFGKMSRDILLTTSSTKKQIG